jgi:hypothetical protein
MNIVELGVTDVSANGALEERHGERQRNLRRTAERQNVQAGNFTVVLLQDVLLIAMHVT